MPGGVVAPVNGARAHLYEGKVTSYVILTSLMAASGGLLFGYDIGITGGVTSTPGFLEKFFPRILRESAEARTNAYCKYDDQLLQLFTSSLFIAGLLGGLLASYTTTRFGRVRMMLISGLCFCLGATLTAAAPILAVLVLGRICLGLGVGFANQVQPSCACLSILPLTLLRCLGAWVGLAVGLARVVPVLIWYPRGTGCIVFLSAAYLHLCLPLRLLLVYISVCSLTDPQFFLVVPSVPMLQSVPLYLSEMAPANIRGALNQMFQMATTIGILVAQLINYGTQHLHLWGWRLSLGLAGPDREKQAGGGARRPAGHQRCRQECRYVSSALLEAEFDDIVQASQRTSEVRHPFMNIFTREHRPELTFAIIIPIFQQLTGINAIMFYVAPLFNTLGFGQSAALYSAVITGAVNVLAMLVSIFCVDRLGRKVLFLVGGIQMFIMQVGIGVILGIAFGDGSKQLSSAVSAVVVVLIYLYVAGFAWSWGPLGWLVPSEIQPLETRSAGQSITVACNFLFTFIISQAFLSMLCSMRFGIFLFFAAWVLVTTVSVLLFLPETKGVPLEEMAGIWRSHWFWKNRVGMKSAAADTDVELSPGAAAAGPGGPAGQAS
eukprot:jgi/Mesen1/7806/ME000408S06901